MFIPGMFIPGMFIPGMFIPGLSIPGMSMGFFALMPGMSMPAMPPMPICFIVNSGRRRRAGTPTLIPTRGASVPLA